jgi:hypothetical protein
MDNWLPKSIGLFSLVMGCVVGMNSAAALAQWSDYPQLIANESSDREVREGTKEQAAGPIGRVGAGPVAGKGGRAVIWVFKLPERKVSGTITDASVWFSVLKKVGKDPGRADLYALGVRDSAAVPHDLYYEGPAQEAEGVTLIQRNILTQKMALGRVQTTWEAGHTLARYIQDLYAKGAKPGQYLLLRLNPQGNYFAEDRGYDVAMGQDPAGPTLRLSTDLRGPGLDPGADNPELAMEARVARRSDDLVESMGVATHIPAITLRADYEKLVRSGLLDLGIRYFRDGGTNQEFFDRVNELAGHGIKGCMVVIPEGEMTASQIVQERILPMIDSIWAVEAINEPDSEWRRFPGRNYKGQHYPDGAILFEKELYEAVKHSPDERVRKLVFLPSSLAFPHARLKEIGALPGDMADLHPYQGGQLPDDQLETKWLPPMRQSVEGKADAPVVVTETGWHNQLDAAGQPGISEVAAARYSLRVFLDFFCRGIYRTHLYNLSADRWGLLRPDGSRKPAFYAIQSLIRITSDKGETFEPGKLSFGLSGQTGSVRHLLLQKRDGRFLLVLWQNAFSYDTRARQDLTVPEREVTLSLGQDVQGMQLYLPLITDRPIRSLVVKDGKVNLAVPDYPIIVEINAQ